MSLNNLTPEQVEFFRLTMAHLTRDMDPYTIAILKSVWGCEDNSQKIIETLRSQQRDNEGVLVAVLGFDASEKLKEILP